jgi:hypothetical protein
MYKNDPNEYLLEVFLLETQISITILFITDMCFDYEKSLVSFLYFHIAILKDIVATHP